MSFESGTDFAVFLVRQSIVPSAMLVLADKMATTRNTIPMILHVKTVIPLSASWSEVDEVVCMTELFTILRKMQPYCHAIDDTKKRVNLLLTLIAGHELMMVIVLMVTGQLVTVLVVTVLIV